ncbi:hypothetical protein PUN28_001296 [Cardiocondyla obscurior]|uniref:Uncharacterized protein n=1 Tax=Cardiocondyla obscurior TaxID=286306 RepID=A0AAW2H4U3_9HYME
MNPDCFPAVFERLIESETSSSPVELINPAERSCAYCPQIVTWAELSRSSRNHLALLSFMLPVINNYAQFQRNVPAQRNSLRHIFYKTDFLLNRYGKDPKIKPSEEVKVNGKG